MTTVRPHIHVKYRAPHQSGTLKYEKQRENERKKDRERDAETGRQRKEREQGLVKV